MIEYDESQDLSETKYEWFYDTDQGGPFASANTLGRLTRRHSAIGDMFVSYDGFGRPNKRAFVDATDEAHLEQYDHHGDGSLARLELKLPDTGYAAEEWNYAYDSAGALRSVTDGITGVPLYEAHTIDPFGRVLSASYGPEVTVNASFANTGRRLPIQLTTLLDSGASRDIQYGSFDAAGREEGRVETMGPAGPTSIASSYDALGRLETSFASGGALEFNTTFTYDALGNITSLDDTSAPKHVSLQFLSGANTDLDRLCRVDYGPPIAGPCTVRHDGSGNVLAMPTQTGIRTLTYFPSGAIKQISQGTTQANFRYDGSGEISELDVVGLKDPRQTRRYGLVERRRLNTGADILVRSIPGAGGIVATRRGPSGPYITAFSESRGLRFSTDGTKFAQDVSYLPFGQSVSSGDLNSLTYTSEQWNGGDNLSDLGVVQVGARIYDPALGRFLSRDPLLILRTASLTNPYAFAANDPINFSDPSGLDYSGGSVCASLYGGGCDPANDGDQRAVMAMTNVVGFLFSASMSVSNGTLGTKIHMLSAEDLLAGPLADGSDIPYVSEAISAIASGIQGYLRLQRAVWTGITSAGWKMAGSALGSVQDGTVFMGPAVWGAQMYQAVTSLIDSNTRYADELSSAISDGQGYKAVSIAAEWATMMYAAADGARASVGMARSGDHGGGQTIYRTGTQTDKSLTDSTGVSFRDSFSSAADGSQTFRHGEKVWGVDTNAPWSCVRTCYT